jgi:hypothetical protein
MGKLNNRSRSIDRNIWRVDGLYFLGIENKFGTEAATEIDAGVWESMATIEAKSLKRVFMVGEIPGVATFIDLLRKSSWALDQPFKTIEISDKQAILSIDRCRTQETRLSKGFCEFPCKKVRFGYLKNFAKTLNSNVEVNCLVCPPKQAPSESMVQMGIYTVIFGFYTLFSLSEQHFAIRSCADSARAFSRSDETTVTKLLRKVR